jgi:hypothetical protein
VGNKLLLADKERAMDEALRSHVAVLDLNSRLFRNCLVDIDDKKACERPNEHTNNMAFIALHLVDARFYMGKLMGIAGDSPFKKRYEDVTTIAEIEGFPSVSQLLSAWNEISSKLMNRFPELTPEELEADYQEYELPIDSKSIFGAIAFFLEHESFHIGQLAFLRKYFKQGAMRYQN